MIILVAVLISITGLYLLCLRPNTGRREAMKVFGDKYIAHRGLYDNVQLPENSLPAFLAAAECGYGIELDVRLTKDEKVVVFHDATLLRMCGVARKVSECTYEELRSYALAGSNERILLFGEVLKAVDGKVPLIVEIKASEKYKRTAEKVAEVFCGYSGMYCIESFNPLVVRWFRKKRPEVLRGQLSTNYFKDKMGKTPIDRFVMTNLLINFLSRPDFIAYNHEHAEQFSFRLCKRLYNGVCAAWTVRSEAELESAREEFEMIIFDGFVPERV
ncbi:MAG: glycerophosphodiester phosphodiesterase [Lachnospiraceae bacterium]|nr:glycerophosphodiester phosphodiesterase [Lachnospiraceae bacterium]